MKVFKYSRKEALKNKSYSKISIKPRLYFVLALIALIAFIALLIMMSAFLGFVFTMILIILAMFGMPIAFALYFVNKNNWFTRAFILDDNNLLWFVEQFDKSYNNKNAVNDKAYIDIMDKCKKSKKTNKGKAIELSDIYMQQETRKYYICKYTNSRGYIEQIKILKAYEDIKEILIK